MLGKFDFGLQAALLDSARNMFFVVVYTEKPLSTEDWAILQVSSTNLWGDTGKSEYRVDVSRDQLKELDKLSFVTFIELTQPMELYTH